MPTEVTAPDVNYQAEHPDFVALRPEYQLLEDVMAGESRIKSCGSLYLPHPSANDTEGGGAARYESYLQRAIFSNITRRMARALVGMGFLRDPVIELPPELEALMDDINGSGLPIDQFAKELALQVLVYGRAGVLTDYPRIPSGARITMEQGRSRVRPYLDLYRANEIVNWMVSGYRLQFVMLRRKIDVVNESLSVWKEDRWRLLQMSGGTITSGGFAMGGQYAARLYGFSIDNDKQIDTTVVPTGADGAPFDHITFSVCGAFSNDWSLDEPPLYPVGTNNVGHYRDSADAAEISFIAGQPQVFIADLDNAQVQQSKDKTIYVGARTGMILGPQGRAFMLQADPNPLPRQLMLDKESLMERLGVQLAIGSSTGGASASQTATQVVQEGLVRNSALTSTLRNVSLTMTSALRDACLYVGANPDAVKFEINTSVDVDEAMDTVSRAVRGRPGDEPPEVDNSPMPPRRNRSSDNSDND